MSIPGDGGARSRANSGEAKEGPQQTTPTAQAGAPLEAMSSVATNLLMRGRSFGAAWSSFRVGSNSNSAGGGGGSATTTGPNDPQTASPGGISGSGGDGSGVSTAGADQMGREELMQLCMKLSRRLKAVEGKAQELARVNRETADQRDELINFIVLEVLKKQVPSEGMHMTLGLLQKEWVQEEEERALALRQIQREHQDAVRAKEEELQVARVMLTSLREATTPPPTSTLVAPPEEPSTTPAAEDESAGDAPTPLQAGEATNEGGEAAAEEPASSVVDEQQTKLQQQLDAANRSLGQAQSRAADLQKQVSELQGEKRKLQAVVEDLSADLATTRAHVDRLIKDAEGLRRSLDEEKDRVLALQTRLESTEAEHEEKVVYLQLELKSAKQSDESNRTALDRTERLNKQLMQENEECKLRMRVLEEAAKRVSELEEQLASTSVLNAEKDVVVEELRNRISQLRNDNNLLKTQLEKAEVQAAEVASKYELLTETVKQKDQALARNTQLRAELDEARQNLAEKNAVLTRIRGEMAQAEQLHGSRTAQVVALEQELQELHDEVLSERRAREGATATVQSLRKDLEREKKLAQEAQDNLTREAEERRLERSRMEVEMAAQVERHEEDSRKAKEQQFEELATVKREYQKKSALAREMISEKDAQVRELTARVEALEAEVACGGHSERKIMELAAVQARRESQQRAEAESTATSLKKLQEAIEKKDLDLARVTAEYSSLQTELTGLRRVRRREEVNLEYLKNVVVEYMCFPYASSERDSLERVISMLLAFTPSDISKVQSVRQNGLSWLLGPMRPVKDITAAALPSSGPSRVVAPTTHPTPQPHRNAFTAQPLASSGTRRPPQPPPRTHGHTQIPMESLQQTGVSGGGMGAPLHQSPNTSSLDGSHLGDSSGSMTSDSTMGLSASHHLFQDSIGGGGVPGTTVTL